MSGIDPGERRGDSGARTGVTPPPPARYERLEEQLNDLTELHQNEMTNLKQELASMEEKVAYQSYERARDIQVPPGTTLGRPRRADRAGSSQRVKVYPMEDDGTGCSVRGADGHMDEKGSVGWDEDRSKAGLRQSVCLCKVRASHAPCSDGSLAGE